MATAPGDLLEFKKILDQKQAELLQSLRKREGIAIEKSADQMDEIQYASERDLAIQNADRETTLLREVKAALQRIRDGSFGTCIQCDWAVNPKRLAAVPWAPLCIECQEANDRDQYKEAESFIDAVVKAA